MASFWRSGNGWLKASPQALAVVVLVSFLIWTFYSRSKAATRVARSQSNGRAVSSTITPLTDFDWRKHEPHKFRAFKPVYHITLALQATTPSDLIVMDNQYLNRVLLRRSLIQKYPDIVHGYLPEGVAAVQELYTFLLGDYLPTRFPSMFRLSGEGKIFQNLVTEKTFPVAPGESAVALRALGETVEDDMFLLQDTPDGHLCVAFVCCFPSGFDPSQKFGKHLKAIHAPVPAYEKIGPSMERIFSKLEVGKSVKRLNWSVQTHDELFNCEGNHITKPDADMSVDHNVDVSKTYLRVELQTLTRLPRTRAILFSFKTHMYPISELKAEGLGPDFADAIEGLKSGNAPGMWVYKGSVRWAERVCEYLRS